METEYRVGAVGPLELRAGTSAPGPGVIGGRAIVYGVETIIAKAFREMVMPGCFTQSLRDDDQRSLFDHKTPLILGRRSAGTLRIDDRRDALYFECDLPDSSYGRDLHHSIVRRDVTGCSFMFRVVEEEWLYEKDQDLPLRRILEAELYELGPVTFPAYEDSTVNVSRNGAAPALTPDSGLALRLRSNALRKKLAEMSR